MKKKTAIPMILLLICSMLTMLPRQVKGSAVDSWVQVNENGFGDPTNRYATAMQTFGGYLYVGTATPCKIWRTFDSQSWEQITSNGFGEPNLGVLSTSQFNGYFYVGTENNVGGCQIWRSATGNPYTWEKVVSDGFVGDPGIITVYVMEVFNGFLYAGTGGGVGHPLTLWRTNDGTNWTPVTMDGFGDSKNIRLTSMCVFGDYLYIGTSNEVEGGEVWRSQTGNPGTWELVSSGGFGDWRNTYIYGSAVFKGYLYLGTEKWTPPSGWYGGEIWRTQDGVMWERIVTDGFGNPDNTDIHHLIVFNDNIFAGTRTFQGCQVWKSSDGTTWMQVNDKGFGDSGNRYVTSMCTFHNSLYVGTWNSVDGCEIWATPPPPLATIDVNPNTLNLRSKGIEVTAYIELNEGYDVANINVSSILLNDTIPAEPKPIEIGDYDEDGISDLMVKFNRTEVESYIMDNVDIFQLVVERFTTVTLTISGKLNDGTPFQGSDTIKIILPPRKTKATPI